MAFANCYEDAQRAEAYSTLGFAGTYYLAFRDLPEIIRKHGAGTAALDFGCGTGRSTRFLRELGLEVTGIDVSEPMVARAREADPGGDYRVIRDGDFSQFTTGAYDLVLSAFTFDNIPGTDRKVELFQGLGRLLKPTGRVINLVSSPEIYVNEWESFSTKEYPENRNARSGDIVRIITTDFADGRPAEDIFWTDESYREVYTRAGLELLATYKPLASGDEPYQWVNETRIAPWVIYVLRPAV